MTQFPWIGAVILLPQHFACVRNACRSEARIITMPHAMNILPLNKLQLSGQAYTFGLLQPVITVCNGSYVFETVQHIVGGKLTDTSLDYQSDSWELLDLQNLGKTVLRSWFGYINTSILIGSDVITHPCSKTKKSIPQESMDVIFFSYMYSQVLFHSKGTTFPNSVSKIVTMRVARVSS